MHLLYLQQLLVLPGSAGNDRSFDFARRWVKEGHKVTFIASAAMLKPGQPHYPKEKIPAHLNMEGIDIYLLDVPYDHQMSFSRRIWSFVRFYRQALKLGKSLSGFDAVLAWSAPLSVGELGRKLARYHQVSFFFEVADVWPDVPIGMGIIRNRRLINWLHHRTRKIYEEARMIYPFSEGMRDQILAQNVPIQKIQVIYNGADGEKIPFVHRMHDRKTVEVLYAGTIGKANDLTQIVQAARMIQGLGHRNIRFTIVGAGNDATRVKAYAGKCGLSNLRFLNQIPRDEISRILNKADIGILSFAPFPVLEANGATKFFDYLASGLPVVINYEGWQAEYLSRYGCGLSAPQGKMDEFAQQILRLAGDAQLRKQMGEKGRQLAEGLFDRGVLAKEMLDSIIREV